MHDLLSAKYVTKIATWNVRTAYTPGRLAQIIKKMKSNNIDILGTSEMRWLESGQLVSDDVTVMFSGGSKHESGVGLLLSKGAARSLIAWEPVSDRLMTARLKTRFTTIIQAYAPTESASDTDKDDFYEQLNAILDAAPSHVVKILMGDFNAQIGPDRTGFENVMGNETMGRRTDNGERLLSMCNSNELKVGGSIFAHKHIHKGTWRSADGTTVNQIDHICISRRWTSALQDVRVYRGADVAGCEAENETEM